MAAKGVNWAPSNLASSRCAEGGQKLIELGIKYTVTSHNLCAQRVSSSQRIATCRKAPSICPNIYPTDCFSNILCMHCDATS